jgi:type IV secretion system protein VirB3
MIGGVTYGYAVFNVIVTLELFLITKSLWVAILVVALHAMGCLGCLRDRRFFDLWLTRARNCQRVPNFKLWHANAYMP